MKLNLYIDLLKNMGLRYVSFRVLYIIKTKLGFFKRRFPTNVSEKSFLTLENWRTNTPTFFFQSRKTLSFPKTKSGALKSSLTEIKEGVFTFFSAQKINLGKDYNWITNPVTNYKYNIEEHFSTIQDISQEAGDIKFVWEKARFSFLYDIIRYDYNYDVDESKFVFQQIEDFIDKSPINQGPNYKCSQEISLRIFNWTFALYYYKNSPNLTEQLFNKILSAIYWQLHHVYHNINFSRIAVRNNHAITETLMLYLSGFLFPFIPETKKWSQKGKKWFQQEVDYQIYEDGTYLQFSMNYHRVVLQLLTWGIRLAELNNDTLDARVYIKAQKSLDYLDACLNIETGELPNYGSNDGALFFKFTDDDYRNYTSQLDDLRALLHQKTYYNSKSFYWYGIKGVINETFKARVINSYPKGGYYIVNDSVSKTFIKCGSYKDRPAQSDNLHLDIWVEGINYLRDAGSYKYNTSKELLNYFTGTEGHNTISIKNKNQMLKGSRFIWFNWIKKSKAILTETKNSFIFDGEFEGFKEVAKGIIHQRKVIKTKGELTWDITDTIKGISGQEIAQYWHLNPKTIEKIAIETFDNKGNKLEPVIEDKWYSGYYGLKEKSIRLTFRTTTNVLKTKIIINT